MPKYLHIIHNKKYDIVAHGMTLKEMKGKKKKYRAKYGNINFRNYKIPIKKKLTGASIIGAIGKKVANTYRRINCNGKARDLYEGELHYGCHNFTGPGTRMDLPEVRNFAPYNNIDACSRQHDIEYGNAGTGSDRPKKIREADERAIKCYDQYPDENGYLPARLGISGKMVAENYIPGIKNITGKYYGMN